MNDQTKLAESILLMAVRLSLVLSRTVERRGRGFRTLNRFKLYCSLPRYGHFAEYGHMVQTNNLLDGIEEVGT